MKIIIINGSHRKNGATALILRKMHQKLKTFPDIEIQFYHIADLNLKYCIGCCKCYKNGKCVFNDDLEELSEDIETANGIIIGSPTYAGNVSGQIKVLIDTAKLLNRLLCYSGATVSDSLVIKTPFSKNPLNNPKIQKIVDSATDRFYKDIHKQKIYFWQKTKHFIIFRLGVYPFVRKKGNEYQGVVAKWKKYGIKNSNKI